MYKDLDIDGFQSYKKDETVISQAFDGLTVPLLEVFD
jgi:hypothetical protein